jgi:cell division protein FtsZ
MVNQGSSHEAGSEVVMEISPHAIPHFVLIGCGGAGIKVIDRIGKDHIPEVKTVTADSDTNALASTRSDVQILLGNNLIKGWREGNPAESAHAVFEERLAFEHLFAPGGIVFIVTGLGGVAGSGSAPEIAKIAHGKGSLVIAIALFPLRIQRKTIKNAEEGLGELLRFSDSVIVIDNDRYRNIFSHLSAEKVFGKVNGIAVDVISRLIESISLPYLINIDPDDFPALFRNKGMAIILSGESRDADGNKNEQVVRQCLNSPSCDIDYRSATGCIVLITAGQQFKRDDTGEIVSLLTNELLPTAEVVWCSNKNKSMNGKVRVYAIMTGIQQHFSGGIHPGTKEQVKRERTYEGPY